MIARWRTATCGGSPWVSQGLQSAPHPRPESSPVHVSVWSLLVHPNPPLSLGDPTSPYGKEFLVEKALIAPGFDVHAKQSQGISEFYADDIALLKLTQKVKMSTHARCLSPGWEGILQRTAFWKVPEGILKAGPCDGLLSPQADLPSLHGGGQHGSSEIPRRHL